MRAIEAVILDISMNPRSQCRRSIVLLDVHILVFETSEEALCTDIVATPSLAVHRNLHALFLKKVQISSVCKMAPLVRVDDLRISRLQRTTQAKNNKLLLQTETNLVIDYISAVPVDNNKQI